jgi:transcriptional regulator with XRE-family HTH domain
MTIKPIQFKLSKRIRQLRKDYGYTQVKLAELSGIEYKHIQLLEGKKPDNVKITTLEKLAKAFDMKLSKFIDFA